MMLLNKLKATRYMQYISALSATLSITCTSLFTTWSSPTLPKLTSSDSPIGVTLTQEEVSWVASIFLLGAVAGVFISGRILARFGRKTTLLLCALPMFLPWPSIIFARSVLTLYIARFIAGVGTCIIFTVVPIYIGETSDKDIRGKLGTTVSMLSITGVLFVLTIGPFVSYAVLGISCSVFPVIFAATFCLMPESPYCLVQKNRREQARANLIALSARGVDEKAIEAKLDEIDRTVEQDMKNKSTIKELLTNTKYRRALIIMTGLKIIQYCTGTAAIEVYLQTIMAQSKSTISPELSSIIFGVIQIPAVLVTAVIVDKVGRKPLLIVSVIGCVIGLMAEGTYFYLLNVANSSIMDSLSWLPITGVVLVVIMKALGLGTLPYVLLGELFPTNVKEQAVALFAAIGSLLGFLVVKFFQPISNKWGMHSVFWMYAGSCVLGTIFIVVVVPETKGKTFMEIQDKLNKNNKTILP